MIDMTAASKAADMVLRASVRMLIWTDMAPSCAKVVATAAAARKGMNIGSLSGLWGEKKDPRISPGGFGAKCYPDNLST